MYPVYIPFLTKPKASVIVENRTSNKVLTEVIGILRTHPISEKKGYGNYPSFSIITVNGVNEVFEHREAGAILYITDDPEITKAAQEPR